MYSLGDLASHVGGRVHGDPSISIEGVQPFEIAGPADITLAAGPRFLKILGESRAGAAIVPASFDSEEKPLLQVENPKLAFAQILSLFLERPFQPLGISRRASIGPNCRIHDRVSIHPLAWVGEGVIVEEEVTLFPGVSVGDGCRVGAGSTLHPNVVLYPGVRLGRRVIVHSGSVLGADGFGYVLDGRRQVKIPQSGTVVVHDDVEIGANSCIDRATFGSTVIEKNVKIDNLVHIGHNCRVGESTVIVGCVGISGSVNIGRNCVLAGQCGVIDHIDIGDDVTVMVKTAVTRDVPAGTVVSGMYCRPHREQLRIEAAIRKLPQFYSQWKEMKSEFEELKQKVETGHE